jgi:hypothetical protein
VYLGELREQVLSITLYIAALVLTRQIEPIDCLLVSSECDVDGKQRGIIFASNHQLSLLFRHARREEQS